MVATFIKDRRTRIGGLLVLLVLGIWRIAAGISPSAAERASNDPTFIDSVTGHVFQHAVHVGETMPVLSPFTGRRTGYPVAWSWWSKSGHVLTKPQPVLMNSWIGKGGPTFAPGSGRLVYPMESRPLPGARPPPTKRQYEADLVEAELGNPANP